MSTNEFTKDRSGTGTKEWSDISYNIQKGCQNGCLYCYAKARALRFREIDTHDQWTTETINMKAVNKKWHKRDGVIMFPTAHDITPDNIDYCITALKNMLEPGNQVLIVSKPHLSCVEKMCAELEPWKDQILFRFTICSMDESICAFWEPGAPPPSERYFALTHAFKRGFQTSVSMEPMLNDKHDVRAIVWFLERYVTDTIWIGKMNKVRSRVDMSNPDNKFMVEDIEREQSDGMILKIFESLKDEPKVRWKDSIKKVVGNQFPEASA